MGRWRGREARPGGAGASGGGIRTAREWTRGVSPLGGAGTCLPWCSRRSVLLMPRTDGSQGTCLSSSGGARPAVAAGAVASSTPSGINSSITPASSPSGPSLLVSGFASCSASQALLTSPHQDGPAARGNRASVASYRPPPTHCAARLTSTSDRAIKSLSASSSSAGGGSSAAGACFWPSPLPRGAAVA